MSNLIYNIIMSATRQTTPILLAATGGAYSDRSGLANITLEPSMIIGCFFAVLGSYLGSSSWMGILFAIGVGIIVGGLFAFICLYMGGNNTVVGISFALIAWGLTTFLLVAIYGTSGSFVSKEIVPIGKYTIPLISEIPIIGGMFKNQTMITYFSWFFVIFTRVLLYKTRIGMAIRACGENPQAAATVGYSVRHIQFLCAVITSVASALAGAHMSLGLVTMFTEKMTAGKGFIALAAVTYGRTSLWKIVAISFLFGVSDTIAILFKTYNYPSFLIQMIPYIIVVIFVAVDPAIKYFRDKKKRTFNDKETVSEVQ